MLGTYSKGKDVINCFSLDSFSVYILCLNSFDPTAIIKLPCGHVGSTG